MSPKSPFAKGVRVKPCSKADLRNLAIAIRRTLRLENVAKFPVIRFLEFLQLEFEDFEYEIVPPGTLPKGVFSWFNPFKGIVSICETYYIMANKGNGFARWTILHECLHFILHKDQMAALARKDNHSHRIYEDSEWQADTLACELLMPLDHINKDMTVEEVAKLFGVSQKAARIRLNNLNKGD